MEEKELMIKIEDVTKVYKLGVIGGTTLKESLQRLHAKIHKKEDPTKKIGAKNYNKGEKFSALNGVSFEVERGQAIGLIGHNGAGKSTLLKLLTRVTAPTSGKIYLNGRVASMLEVGTGFHGELTGRENIYMNGAILGMTKKEIDAKIEDIIEFSEVRQFIDTPVKRYSSGMFVKLAFSVAAHLDAEIMLMDEVLAVGDMAFQNKCIKKMREVADSGRTIIYVSHNMNTIRQLCDKVVVLDKGQVVFNGDVEEGVKIYMGASDKKNVITEYKLGEIERLFHFGKIAKIQNIRFLNKDSLDFEVGEDIQFELIVDSSIIIPDACILLSIKDYDFNRVGAAISKPFSVVKDKGQKFNFKASFKMLMYGKYFLNIALMAKGEMDNSLTYDDPGARIMIELHNEYAHGIKWENRYWGRVVFPEIELI